MIPGAPPDWPESVNITRAALAGWEEPDFRRAMREGRRPTGAPIDKRMPWEAYRGMTEDELHALWLFVQSMPPVQPGGQG